MTEIDRSTFAQVAARLAITLREPSFDVGRQRLYFDALKDLELPFLAAAADRLAAGATFFPKPGEWRAMAQRIETERRREQQELIRKRALRGDPLCAVCGDNTWAGDPAQTVRRCDCQELRRLELLGRRPWPRLTGDVSQEDRP